MISTRAKGRRSLKKAKAFASTFPNTVFLEWFQQSGMWHRSTPQPFDVLLLRAGYEPILLEVRSNQWGASKPQTRVLATLPGNVLKQLWMFKDRERTPHVRAWCTLTATWMAVNAPWGETIGEEATR